MSNGSRIKDQINERSSPDHLVTTCNFSKVVSWTPDAEWIHVQIRPYFSSSCFVFKQVGVWVKWEALVALTHLCAVADLRWARQWRQFLIFSTVWCVHSPNYVVQFYCRSIYFFPRSARHYLWHTILWVQQMPGIRSMIFLYESHLQGLCKEETEDRSGISKATHGVTWRSQWVSFLLFWRELKWIFLHLLLKLRDLLTSPQSWQIVVLGF